MGSRQNRRRSGRRAKAARDSSVLLDQLQPAKKNVTKTWKLPLLMS
jgi:hypothetical protein